MNKSWPKVRLGDVLRRSEEMAVIVPDVEYREITVRLWGKGVVERGRISGAEISGNRRFVARAGQFIVSRIDARNGAMGIVPTALDGAVVTNDFPLLTADETRLSPTYLGWLCRTSGFVELCLRASEGTTNRVRLKEERFFALEVPLPSLTEQRRIVARIDELAAHIHEVRTLRQQVIEDLEILCRVILSADDRAVKTPMKDLVRLRKPDVRVLPEGSYKFAGVYSFGRGLFSSQERSGMEFSYPLLTRLRTGDFTYPKLMAWEGAFGVVPEDCDGHVVSTEFPVFEIGQEVVLPEVLDVYFRSPAVWPEIAGASTGTNVRRRRLNPKDFLNYQIPLPSSETQLKLRSVKQQVEIVKHCQSVSTAELDALLPSVLDRAFLGVL